MKRVIIAIICAVSVTLGVTAEAYAAQTQSCTTSQAPTKKARKGGAKTTGAKKYVPASYGDCYVGEQMYLRSGDTNWCELTFNSNGTCVLKTKGYSTKGTFTGTVTGSKYKITVRFSDGTKCVFTGNKERLEGQDDGFSYVLNLEH